MEVPEKFAALGLTYDDVLLLPGHSDLAPDEIDTTTRLTREISIKVPISSSFSTSWCNVRLGLLKKMETNLNVPNDGFPCLLRFREAFLHPVIRQKAVLFLVYELQIE